MEDDPGSPDSYPRHLILRVANTGGAIVQADEAAVYLDLRPAWDLVAELVHPALNVEPEGNC